MRIPTVEEVGLLLSHADSPRVSTRKGFRAYVALCAFAGLRKGEAAAVQMGDIDFLHRQPRGAALTWLLGASALTSTQWLLGALPALVLLIAWEVGKTLARRQTSTAAETVPTDVGAVATPA